MLLDLLKSENEGSVKVGVQKEMIQALVPGGEMPAVSLSLSWTSRGSLNLRECEHLNTAFIEHIDLCSFLLLSILVTVTPSLGFFIS